jgi:hypothetical protein
LDISTQTPKTAGGKQEAVGRDIKANLASSSFQIPAETLTSNDTLQSASLTTCLETALRALDEVKKLKGVRYTASLSRHVYEQLTAG